MLIVDTDCSDVCCGEFPVPQIDRKSKQVTEHSDTINQYGENLGMLNTKISKNVDK